MTTRMMSGGMVFAGFVILMVLGYDFWWIGQKTPLLFGWIPLWVVYHLVIQALLIALLAVWVYQRWPEDDE